MNPIKKFIINELEKNIPYVTPNPNVVSLVSNMFLEGVNCGRKIQLRKM
jgi:hypothetical protein